MNDHEGGFTLVELLMAIAIAGIMLTLSVTALHRYWFVQGLNGALHQSVTQMRQAQQQAQAETHPLVYGVWFINESSRWGTLQYDPNPADTTPCEEIGPRTFENGVQVASAGFTTVTTPALTATCRSALSAKGIPNSGNAQIAFFYARGNSNGGAVTLKQVSTGQTRHVEVAALTGRIEE